MSLIALALAAGGSVGSGAAAQPPGQTTWARGTGEDLALLRDASADPSARTAAAKRLVESSDEAARAAIVLILTPEAAAEPGDPQGIVLREIANQTSASPAFLPGLASLLETVPGEAKPRVVAAISSVRTRDAVRLLLNTALNSTAQPVRDAAFAAIGRLTGRTDLGSDGERWRTWFADVEFLPETEWRRVLSLSLAERADRVARDRDRAVVRLAETLRQRYLDATSPESRATQLVALIRDDLVQVRRLGLELVSRELANARVPDGSVSAALLDILRDPAADVRQAAAELVVALAPRGAETAFVPVLMAETEPAAAAAQLRAAARWPSPTVKPVVLGWLERPGPARRAAIEATAALYDRELLDGSERGRVLQVLREIGASSLPPPGLRLLDQLGEEADRATIFGLLQSPLAATRLQVGELLAARPDGLEMLLAAAAEDAALFPSAIRAMSRWEATAASYAMAEALPALTPEAKRDGLARLAAALPAPELVAVARRTPDPLTREALLRRFIEAEDDRPEPPSARPREQVLAVREAALLLARTQLDLAQPLAALSTLQGVQQWREGVPEAGATFEAAHRAMHILALIWLNRLDEAAALDAPITAWLDGLDACIALPHAPQVLMAIDTRFRGPHEPGITERLRRYRARLFPSPNGVKEANGLTPGIDGGN